ncbi:MAG: hypothetical protein LBG06_11030 [Deltaproteobacteria bacterium]|jgi:TPR repeat protein|nr:hypothetical protein [Deltaproteobacteria bacterium]
MPDGNRNNTGRRGAGTGGPEPSGWVIRPLDLAAAHAPGSAADDDGFWETAKRLEALALRGDASAWWRLGRLHLEEGRDPPARRDEALACACFRKAVEGGCVPALRMLARLCLAGRGTGASRREGFEYMLDAARMFDVPAFLDVALLYRDGIGTERDAAAARLWLTRAAEAGDGRAYLPLCDLLEDPSSGEPDAEAALRWLGAAAEAGEPGARFRAARILLERDGPRSDEAARLLLLAADEGDPRACLALARRGLEGPRRGGAKAAEALRWLEAYLERESEPEPWALRELGAGLAGYASSGLADLKRGANLLRRAAGLGDLRAALDLARLCLEGRGVRRNRGEAFRLAKIAAGGGLAEAQAFLSRLYSEGVGAPRSARSAFRWMLAAAEGGDRDAMREVSRMYAAGEGVKRDPARSKAWKDMARGA